MQVRKNGEYKLELQGRRSWKRHDASGPRNETLSLLHSNSRVWTATQLATSSRGDDGSLV
jgi:hypothetical protein